MRRRVCNLNASWKSAAAASYSVIASAAEQSSLSPHYAMSPLGRSSAQQRSRVSPLVRHARAVEMLLDLGAVAGALETGAEQFGLLERDRGALQTAPEFPRCAAPAGTRPAVGKKHGVPAAP